MDATASGLDPNGMLEVEHLVVEQVLDRTAGGIGPVEDAADDDGVVSRVVVAEHASGGVGAPGERRPAEQTVEESRVERLEDLIEVVVVAQCGGDALAAAGLADVLGLPGDGLGADMAAVAVGVGRGDGLLVELGQQNMRDSVVDGLGRVLEDVGEADVEAAFTEADGGVERGEAAEADVDGRHRRSRANLAVLLFEDGDESR